MVLGGFSLEFFYSRLNYSFASCCHSWEMEGTLEMGRPPLDTQPRNCYVSLLGPTSKKYGLIYTFVSKSGPPPFFLDFREKKIGFLHTVWGRNYFEGAYFGACCATLLLSDIIAKRRNYCFLRPSCPNSLYPAFFYFSL